MSIRTMTIIVLLEFLFFRYLVLTDAHNNSYVLVLSPILHIPAYFTVNMQILRNIFYIACYVSSSHALDLV